MLRMPSPQRYTDIAWGFALPPGKRDLAPPGFRKWIRRVRNTRTRFDLGNFAEDK